METARSNRLIELRRPTGDKFLKFIASLPSVSYELDENFITHTVSSNIIDLLGIRQEFLLGNRVLWQERLFPADRDRLTKRLNEITSGALASEIHRVINDRGLPVWVSHSFWKINSANHSHIRGSMIPLTPELRTNVVETEVVSQFIHKIGNHFQLISLLIGSMKRNRPVSSEVDALEESVQRAVEFTRSFSNFCQVPAQSVPLNLGEILISATQALAPRFDEKRVLLKISGDRSCDGIFLFGDPALLEVAFISVLENALDATKSGDIVTVESKSEVAGPIPSSVAWISITDTGCGMASGILEKAPAPFFSSKRDRNGLGLTLAIRIFEMHRGLVNISSEENRGTRVDIALPIASTLLASEH